MLDMYVVVEVTETLSSITRDTIYSGTKEECLKYTRENYNLLEEQCYNDNDGYCEKWFEINSKSSTIVNRYLAGRFDGIPDFGPVFEDLEV